MHPVRGAKNREMENDSETRSRTASRSERPDGRPAHRGRTETALAGPDPGDRTGARANTGEAHQHPATPRRRQHGQPIRANGRTASPSRTNGNGPRWPRSGRPHRRKGQHRRSAPAPRHAPQTATRPADQGERTDKPEPSRTNGELFHFSRRGENLENQPSGKLSNYRPNRQKRKTPKSASKNEIPNLPRNLNRRRSAPRQPEPQHLPPETAYPVTA